MYSPVVLVRDAIAVGIVVVAMVAVLVLVTMVTSAYVLHVCIHAIPCDSSNSTDVRSDRTKFLDRN